MSKKTLAGLVCVLFVVVGCELPEDSLIAGTGVTIPTRWSVPAGMQNPGEKVGVDVSFTPTFPTLGLYYQPTDKGDALVVPYVAADIGLGARMLLLEFYGPGVWPIFKPSIGMWIWPDTSDNSGLFTGLKLGLGYSFERRRMPNQAITLEYGWLTLHGADDDEKSRLQTLRLAYLWEF